jgi:glycosyltransferase involved in cell wall biosynthesis/SAM-dependent methyltransferase
VTSSLVASIIINNYNYGRYLSQAIDSALAQTDSHVEVIVVDDGSSDDSRRIIASYEERITPILKENGGQASAFNDGFAASSGNIVLFLDADDALHADAVESVRPYFRDDRVVKVHWKLLGMDDVGHVLATNVPAGDIPEGDLRAHTLEFGPNSFVNPPTSGNAWSRTFLSRVMPVRENGDKHGADAYLFVLAPLYGVIRRVDRPLSLYRIHPSNYSGRPNHQLRRDLRRFDQHCALLKEHCMELGLSVEPIRWRANSWIGRLGSFIDQVKSVIPPGATYLLLDEGQFGYDLLDERTAKPFVERNGTYWGAPADDATAINELDRMRAGGADFLVVAWPAFWWLDVYPRFVARLRSEHRCVLETERCIVFDIRASGATDEVTDSAPAVVSDTALSQARFTCPYCGFETAAFRSFGLTHSVLSTHQVVGGGYRPNSMCQLCNSKERDRLLYLYLRNKTELFRSPAKLLHVAPEPRLQELLSDQTHLDYLTADLNSPNVMVKMDITDIQYPDDSFDCIICNHVLEHIPHDRAAMRELLRVLKPGGWAVLQVPISLSLDVTFEDESAITEASREASFGQRDHVRIYGQDYPRRLSDAGFEVEVFEWWKDAADFGGTSNRFGLNRDEKLFVSRKRR